MAKATTRPRQLVRSATRSLWGGALVLLLLATACTERRQIHLMELAEDKITQGQPGEAVELLKKAIALNPESKISIRALYKLGFIEESYLKDMEAALFNYQEFIRLSQDRVSIYEVQKRIANVYFEQLHDADKAIDAYKKLIAHSPDSLEADTFQFRIAQANFQQNRFEQSRLEYQELLEKYPKTQHAARARHEIGNTYYMEGKYDIAVEALKQVLRLNPQSEWATEAQFLMAECLERQEKLQDALSTYQNIEGRYSSPEVLALHIDELKKRLKSKVEPSPPSSSRKKRRR
jgi:tetratricopeptide (TPR) repeat protein